MKISYNWLKRFIVSELSPNQISELLTNTGLEVEGVTNFQPNEVSQDKILVGFVTECLPVSNSKKLKVTKVDIGKDKPLEILCGAPNIKKNVKVAIATIGATIYSNNGDLMAVKPKKMADIESQGVICSEAELGLGDDHSGVLILDGDLEVGSVFQPKSSHEQDHIYEIGLTPNRADAMSHLGVSRDIRAVLKLNSIRHQYFTPTEPELQIGHKDKTIPISIDDREKCLRYYGITITDLNVRESPLWLQTLLKGIGINPKNNIVDITNYILHHLGQPLHAFDADKIDHRIIVKNCPEGTKFETLDGVIRSIDQQDLMICDQSKPLCIAGVMGGVFSGVTHDTKTVFIESAYFDPVSIRKTAKRHVLNTDASFRYERGIDPQIGILAIKKASELIVEIAGGRISSDIQKYEEYEIPALKIDFNLDKLHDLVGKKIPEESVENILQWLDFEVDKRDANHWNVIVPKYRVDVSREADLIEEIFRIYGYNLVPPTPLEKVNSFLPYQKISKYKISNLASEFLTNQGFYEIYTNSLVSKSQQADFHKPVEIANPIGEEFSILKQNPIHNIIQVINHNLNRGVKDIKLFEIANIYGTDGEKSIESERLALAITGNPIKKTWNSGDSPSVFFYLKGILKDLFERFGISIDGVNSTKLEYCNPRVDIYSQGKFIGYYGLISSSIMEQTDSVSTYGELNWEAVCSMAFTKEAKFQPVAKYPGSKRDFSLLIDKSVKFSSIEELSFKTAQNILNKVELFDVYQGKNLPEGKISYGISFIFQSLERTLTDSQVDKNMNLLREAFENELGASLR